MVRNNVSEYLTFSACLAVTASYSWRLFCLSHLWATPKPFKISNTVCKR